MTKVYIVVKVDEILDAASFTYSTEILSVFPESKKLLALRQVRHLNNHYGDALTKYLLIEKELE